jgi:4-hydroxy-2-oxoheptanedioate aldolase
MRAGLKQRIESGDLLIGGTINIFNPAFIEMYCAAGADFIMLDLEHNLKDFTGVLSVIMTADLYQVPVIVRPGEHSSNLVGRLLDAGAAGMVFPQVGTAKEAAELVSWCRYKPQGVRALGYARSWALHQANDPPQRRQANNDVVCLMVIEDLEGARNLTEILNVDGVTGVAMGPGDLALEIGAATWDAPELTKLLGEMAATASAVPGKALMRFTLSGEQAGKNAQSGANMLILHHDVMLVKQMYTDLISTVRAGARQSAS